MVVYTLRRFKDLGIKGSRSAYGGHIHGVCDLGSTRYPAYSHNVCWVTLRFNPNFSRA